MKNMLNWFRLSLPLIAVSAVFSANGAIAHEAEVHNETIVELEIPEIKILEGNKPLECRFFRIRTLDLNPGKAVGIHSHENRPGVLSIVGGEGMTVYAYNYDPVEVLYGNSYKSYNDIVHYAANLSDTETLSIMTTDFLDEGSECNGKTYAQNTPILDKLVKENNEFYANAPQTAEEDEVNHEFYRTLIQDIEVPEGKTPIDERILRIRKVTLAPSATTGVQDYSNRPTYIMNLEGKIEVVEVADNETSTLNAKEAANLINTNEVEIRNSSDDEATYFVIELWDPSDEDIL